MVKKKKTLAKKFKVSNVKIKNKTKTKLMKAGKLKKTKPKKLVHRKKKELPSTIEEVQPEDDQTLVDMIDETDLAYLLRPDIAKSYSLLQSLRNKSEKSEPRRKRQKVKNNEEEKELTNFEGEYEKTREEDEAYQHTQKKLLPIKTKTGLIDRTMERPEDLDLEKNEKYIRKKKEKKKKGDEEEEDNEHEEEKEPVTDYLEGQRKEYLEDEEPVTTAQLMASREGVIQKYKFKIGILASGLLENPEEKIKNLKLLLDIMRSRDPELRVTVKKLVTLSLLEIFKDLLPSYAIKHHNAPGTKLKKETLKLQTYESNLVKGYKDYLALLEYNAMALNRKRGDTRKYPPPIIEVAELCVQCFCDLLITHPYFNFSHNIVQLLTVYLDSVHAPARKLVHKCYTQVFKEDKKGAISLVIVRRINQLVKARARSHPEIISVLLSLRIKDINLDKEKEEELKKKRFMTRQEKLIRMSRNISNNKKAAVLERELLETKAEENKQVKQNYMTEVTKIVFTIYFRILKKDPRSKLLSATLEGLAKFAHCINLDFYQDLVNVLDHLIRTEPLTVREQMHCVQTVFTILSGQGEMLCIDPMHFYTHLYKNLLYVHIGKTQPDLTIILDTFQDILIRRRKKLSQQKILAFTKRLGTLALQNHQHGTLAVMALIKNVLQLTKCGDMLLEADNASGQGVYEPYLEEPEYCNANASSLWELAALQRHYHPTIQKLAIHLMNGAPPTGNGSLPTDLAKLSATDFYSQYDPTEVSFRPAINRPVSYNARAQIKYEGWSDIVLEEYVQERFESVDATMLPVSDD
ncbi:hypothetical protein M8J76_014729 [Diaphorina citri]|nr:hypothetical protein M8J76_014729 [Diaphorina citri]